MNIRDVAPNNIGSMQARILGLKTENVSEAVELSCIWKSYETDIIRGIWADFLVSRTRSPSHSRDGRSERISSLRRPQPIETQEYPNGKVGLSLKRMKFVNMGPPIRIASTVRSVKSQDFLSSGGHNSTTQFRLTNELWRGGERAALTVSK